MYVRVISWFILLILNFCAKPRGAITNANGTASDEIIGFDATVFSAVQTITLDGSELTIANNGTLTINGGGKVIVSGNNASRVFFIDSGTVNIMNSTISDNSALSVKNLLEECPSKLRRDRINYARISFYKFAPGYIVKREGEIK